MAPCSLIIGLFRFHRKQYHASFFVLSFGGKGFIQPLLIVFPGIWNVVFHYWNDILLISINLVSKLQIVLDSCRSCFVLNQNFFIYCCIIEGSALSRRKKNLIPSISFVGIAVFGEYSTIKYASLERQVPQSFAQINLTTTAVAFWQQQSVSD